MPKTKDKTSFKERIIDVDLQKFCRKNYYDYGMAVLEDRAIPDYRDGLLPVNRHSLWSAQEMGLNHTAKYVKSARVVGDTMGKFHPHGDSSIYNAIVNMANSNAVVKLVDGSGNWASMSDGSAAAMRYTEMRLSKFSSEVLFNKFYLPVMGMCPNYDGAFQEPVLIPALLPVVLLNGREGIAPGATTCIPMCETSSVMKLLQKIYSGETIDVKLMYNTLKFRTLYGGVECPIETAEAKQDRKNIFTTTRGRVRLQSTNTWDSKTRTLTVTKFAAFGKMPTLLQNLLDIEGVSEARDDSTKDDKYGTVTVVLKKGLAPKLEANILKHIREKILSSNENYVLNFTERYTDADGKGAARMKPMNLVTMMQEWFKWRVQLERDACSHWIAEADKQILRLDLLMLAVDNRKIIIESLDKDLSQEDLEEWLAKKLGISVKDAAFIYDLKVRQLRKLERKSLEKQKAEVHSKRAELKSRHKTPEPWMAKQLKEFTF